MKSIKNDWVVYIVRCADGTLYTGITRWPLIKKRMAAHNKGVGAKYTRGRGPVELEAWAGGRLSKSEAQRLEVQVKRLPRGCKIQFLRSWA